jgi:hypothetical protein
MGLPGFVYPVRSPFTRAYAAWASCASSGTGHREVTPR